MRTRKFSALAVTTLALSSFAVAACDDNDDGVDDEIQDDIEGGVDSIQDDVEGGVDSIQDEIEDEVEARRNFLAVETHGEYLRARERRPVHVTQVISGRVGTVVLELER